MNYFDKRVETVFQKDENGKTIFYPWGIFSKGYIVNSQARENQIRRSYKNVIYFNLICLLVFASLPFWFGHEPFKALLVTAISLLLLYLLVFYCIVNMLTKGLVKSPDRLKASAVYQKKADSLNAKVLIALAAVYIIGFLITLVLLFMQGLHAGNVVLLIVLQ